MNSSKVASRGTVSAAEPTRRPARERLLDAAHALFYENGIHTVGIDTVIERAGVAKASLYDCFGSKEGLIQAYLQSRQERRVARITERLSGCKSPRERVLAMFDQLAEYVAHTPYRGCVFMRAGAEHRHEGVVKTVCDDARQWMLDLFTRLAKEAGATRPKVLARQLVLLYDGASVSAQMDGGADAAIAARAAAAFMLDANTRKKKEAA